MTPPFMNQKTDFLVHFKNHFHEVSIFGPYSRALWLAGVLNFLICIVLPSIVELSSKCSILKFLQIKPNHDNLNKQKPMDESLSEVTSTVYVSIGSIFVSLFSLFFCAVIHLKVLPIMF